jgi:hypothetical protein
MSSAVELFSDSAFDAETTAAMASAFEKACLTICGTHQVNVLKEIIAKQIIVLAREGKTDADSLYAGALLALGLDKSGRDPLRVDA